MKQTLFTMSDNKIAKVKNNNKKEEGLWGYFQNYSVRHQASKSN